MKQQTRQGCIILLISIILSGLAFDGALRLFDPWGAVRYAVDMRVLLDHTTDSEMRGYTLLPGTYHLSNWTATVHSDGTRAVPNTHHNAACTIALVGDSVTFGYGVNDTDTFANLLALEFPDLNIVNTGVNGYNVEDAQQVIHIVKANGYLYLMINNDAEPPFDWRHAHTGSEVSAASLYFLLIHKEHMTPPANDQVRESFYDTLASITTNPNVVVVGFEQPLANTAAEVDPSVKIIPNYIGFNSRADPHPNATGSREISRMLTPFVEHLKNQVCGVLTF